MLIYYDIENGQILQEERRVEEPPYPYDATLEEKKVYWRDQGRGFIYIESKLGSNILDYRIVFDDAGDYELIYTPAEEGEFIDPVEPSTEPSNEELMIEVAKLRDEVEELTSVKKEMKLLKKDLKRVEGETIQVFQALLEEEVSDDY